MLKDSRKLNGFDLLMIIMLFLQLGMKTNTTYDRPLSLVLSFAVTFVFVNRSGFRIKMQSYMKYGAIWYSVFVGLCALSYFWAEDPNLSYIVTIAKDAYVPLILTIVCIAVYLDTKGNDSNTLIRCLLMAEIVTILRALLHTPLKELIVTFNPKLYGTGLWVNYNYFTSQLALVFIIAFFMAQYYQGRKYKLITAFIGFNILLSASRKAIIVALAGAFALYVFKADGRSMRSRCKKIIVAALVIGLLFVALIKIPLLYNLIGGNLVMAIKTVGKSASEIALSDTIDHSAHGRAVLRTVAFEQFLKHPLWGLGYYCFKYHNYYGLYAHNNYLEILADLGILGFIAYYWFYLYLFVRAKKTLKRKKQNRVWILFAVFMGCLLLMEYGHITMFRLYVLVPWIVVAGAILNFGTSNAKLRDAGSDEDQAAPDDGVKTEDGSIVNDAVTSGDAETVIDDPGSLPEEFLSDPVIYRSLLFGSEKGSLAAADDDDFDDE